MNTIVSSSAVTALSCQALGLYESSWTQDPFTFLAGVDRYVEQAKNIFGNLSTPYADFKRAWGQLYFPDKEGRYTMGHETGPSECQALLAGLVALGVYPPPPWLVDEMQATDFFHRVLKTEGNDISENWEQRCLNYSVQSHVEGCQFIPLVPEFEGFQLLHNRGVSQVWLARRPAGSQIVLKVMPLLPVSQPQFTTDGLGSSFFQLAGYMTLFAHSLPTNLFVIPSAWGIYSDGFYLEMSPYRDSVQVVREHFSFMIRQGVWRTLSDRLVLAVAVLHEKGLVHRDIKPGNLIMESRGDIAAGARLSDFDFLCRSMDARPAIDVVGTPGYIAPEVWEAKPFQFASDVFALAASLWTILTGVVVFDPGDNPPPERAYELVRDKRPPFRGENEIPSPVRQLLYRSMDANPANRPPNGMVFLHLWNEVWSQTASES